MSQPVIQLRILVKKNGKRLLQWALPVEGYARMGHTPHVEWHDVPAVYEVELPEDQRSQGAGESP